jgi:hypothetical protein
MTIETAWNEIAIGMKQDEPQANFDLFQSILQRFALEFVEASVGVKQKCTHQDPQFYKDVKCPKIQWNACREQTLEAARKILGL